MKLLICGAKGFVGRHIAHAAELLGHTVIQGIRLRNQGLAEERVASETVAGDARQIFIDYTKDHDPSTWQMRLRGIDVVINAIGVLRDSRAQPIHAIHSLAPIALFEGAAAAGVKQVIQISANGIEDSHTQYAQTKLLADKALWRLLDAGQLKGVVVRPSVILGKGGASGSMFMSLSKLPILILPRIMFTSRIQPVAVQDLAHVVMQLIQHSVTQITPLYAVGPTALTFAALIANLRAQLGYLPAVQIRLPDAISRLSARLGDGLSTSPWSSEALSLLQKDNIADVTPFMRYLGREPIAPGQLLRHWNEG